MTELSNQEKLLRPVSTEERLRRWRERFWIVVSILIAETFWLFFLLYHVATKH